MLQAIIIIRGIMGFCNQATSTMNGIVFFFYRSIDLIELLEVLDVSFDIVY